MGTVLSEDPPRWLKKPDFGDIFGEDRKWAKTQNHGFFALLHHNI